MFEDTQTLNVRVPVRRERDRTLEAPAPVSVGLSIAHESATEPTQPPYLLPLLLAALDSDGRQPASTIGLESSLRRSWERARTAHPGIEFSWRRFAPALARRLELDDPVGALERLNTPDLYLARAVLSGDAAAGDAFDRLLASAEEEISEAIDDAWDARRLFARLTRMFLLGEGRRPALARYRGRGSLRAWILTEARRLIAATRQPVAVEETATLLAPPEKNPVLGRRHEEADLLRRAFVAAIAKLQPEHRDLLQRYYFEGHTLDGVRKAASPAELLRSVAQAKRRLLRQTRRELAARADVGDKEVDWPIGHLKNGLGVEIGRQVARQAVERPVT